MTSILGELTVSEIKSFMAVLLADMCMMIEFVFVALVQSVLAVSDSTHVSL